MAKPPRAGGERAHRRQAKQDDERDAQLRRSGHHCPLCLAVLPRIAGAAQPARKCARCRAEPAPGKHCARCHVSDIWEGRAGAACAACGHHGSKVGVIAGRGWLDGDDDRG